LKHSFSGLNQEVKSVC